ncbi:MAG: MMPL family transporter, partial [Campylobacterales bacterium]|nr:MMPL family transporter [Campylobacterales bacterium]
EESTELEDLGLVCTKEIASLSKKEVLEDVNQKISQILQEIKEDKFFQRDLISENSVAITVHIEPQENTIEDLIALINIYKEKDLKIHYGGSLRDEYESSHILASDLKMILPLTLLLMSLVMYFSFRNFRGVFIPLLIVSTGIIWTFGLFAFLGGTLNLVTMILPPLLISVGSAYIIHVLNIYNHHQKSKNPIEKTLESISLPMSVTAFTTVAGFAALMLSPIPAIKEMGAYACFGIISVVFLSITLALAILSKTPIQKEKVVEKTWVDKILGYKSDLIEKHSRSFIYSWGVVVFIALLGSYNLSFDSKSSFSKDLEISKDLDYIEKNLGGTSYLKVILQGKKLESAKTIYGIEKIQNTLLNPDLKIKDLRIDKIYSPVEFLSHDRNGLDNLKDKEVEIFFQDFQNDKNIKFLSDDKKQLQFYLRITKKGTKPFKELKESLEQELQKNLPHLKATLTGGAVLANESADNIAKGQVYSILMALGVIFVVLSALFFSFKIGFLALFPNIGAIAIFFGILGWLSIPISVTVSVIAAIALGIGVDDTIHFLSHYNEKVKETRDEKESSLKTLQLIGKPMIYTTLTLSLGFIVFGLSDMESQVLFGVLTAVTLLVCLITDLNLLPSIMAETKLITVWDYVGLKFDEAFIRSVSIFDGLTLQETKIATLMAYTQDLKKDEILFREKDSGNEMFIVLEGEMRLYLDKAFHSKEHTLSLPDKGKSFGEMALFRNQNRVATAKADKETKLLVLNEKVLLDLQNRYPKIARKVFLNLAIDLKEKIKKTEKLVVNEKFEKSADEILDYKNFIEKNSPKEASVYGYTLICLLADELQHKNILAYDKK